MPLAACPGTDNLRIGSIYFTGKLMVPAATLFLVIFLEGYIVLSTELLAIRLMLPFTGSGTDTVSIIIAAILMPLAFGYFAGGKFSAGSKKAGKIRSVRDRLILNLLIAAALLTPALSHAFLEWAYGQIVHQFHLSNRLLVTSIYSLVFLVIPVFLLGQTVPLISNYFSRGRLSLMAGRILFFSTLGSFMGAIFCTLVLMTYLGVQNAAIITIGCMAILVFILSRDKISFSTAAGLLCLALSALINSGAAMDHFNIIKNNKYNMIQLKEDQQKAVKVLFLNRTFASAVSEYDEAPIVLYVSYIDNNFIKPLYDEQKPPRDVLVLGAGGFTMGRLDDRNNYTFIDIDKDLKEVAEKDFLKEELGPNKKFVPMEARAFLGQTEDKYDLIILDLYRDPVSAPEYLITKEFFTQVKNHMKPGGAVVGNYFVSPTFADAYSIRLDNTLRAVFPNINRQVINDYDAWNRENDWGNIIYSYIDTSGVVPEKDSTVYTDDKNTSMFDKPFLLRAVH